jgi:hypothetical protein
VSARLLPTTAPAEATPVVNEAEVEEASAA